MKQKRNLLFLLAGLVLVCLGYYGAISYNEAKAEAEAEAEALLAEESIIYVMSLEEDDIVEISWNYTSELTFELVDDVWVYTADETVPVYQAYITYAVGIFSEVTAEREITGGDALEYYGLEEPLYSVTLTDSSGVETVFYFGDVTEENYYFTYGDKTNVYTVVSSTLDAISYEITDLVDPDTFPVVVSSQIETASVADATTSITYTEDDTDALDMIVTGLSSLSLSTCVDVNASEYLENYGLDEDSRTTFTMVYSEYVEETEDEEDTADEDLEMYEDTLYIGAYDSYSLIYYVQVDGSNMVYAVDGDTVDMIMNVYVAEEE